MASKPPRPGMVRQRVLKGHNGRRKNGYVWMTPEDAQRMQDNNRVVTGLALAMMAILTVIVLLVRGY